jgi:hypothetical protein
MMGYIYDIGGKLNFFFLTFGEKISRGRATQKRRSQGHTKRTSAQLSIQMNITDRNSQAREQLTRYKGGGMSIKKDTMTPKYLSTTV